MTDLGDLVVTFLDESEIFAGSAASALEAERERRSPRAEGFWRSMVGSGW